MYKLFKKTLTIRLEKQLHENQPTEKSDSCAGIQLDYIHVITIEGIRLVILHPHYNYIKLSDPDIISESLHIDPDIIISEAI